MGWGDILYVDTSICVSMDSDPGEGEIRLWVEETWWIANGVETGVTTQGETREKALVNLGEAVALFKGDRGREPTDAELRELGINPNDNVTGDRELPHALK